VRIFRSFQNQWVRFHQNAVERDVEASASTIREWCRSRFREEVIFMPHIVSPDNSRVDVQTAGRGARVEDLQRVLPARLKESDLHRQHSDGSLEKLQRGDVVGPNEVVVATPSHVAG
jgi:hypothetical protein